MAAPTADPRALRFGLFEVDLTARELRKQGRKISLQEQPFRVLALLLQHAGEIVTREELRQALWPANTFVEFDQGLNTAIKKIRLALGDSADHSQYIETLPRQGYRLLMAVEVPSLPVVERPRRSWPTWFAGVMAVIAAGTGLVWFLNSGHAEDEIGPVPMTTFVGAETGATLSADGTQIAFTWDGEKKDNFDIYVKRLGSALPQRLTTDPALDFGAAWSPDGRFIAFLRPLTPESTGVFLISPYGGDERRIGQVAVAEDFLVGPYLAWSRDGKSLFTVDKIARSAPYNISLLSVETDEKRPLTYPDTRTDGDFYPTLSADGRQLAFTRFGPGPDTTLQVLNLNAYLRPVGEPRAIFKDDRWLATSCWMPNGRELLFTSGTHFAEGTKLWRTAISGTGRARPLVFASSGSCCATFSPDGRRMVYSRLNCPENLYRINLHDGLQVDHATKLAASTSVTEQPDFSGDDRKVLFVSYRSGSPEIWACDREGQNLVQLTSFGARELQGPRWSPDGKKIVFSMRRPGSPSKDLYLVRSDGSGLKRLTNGHANNVDPTWSRDGRFIYFGSDASGQNNTHFLEGREMQVWKMRPDGHGMVQVTPQGGSAPQEAADGESLYFLKQGGADWDAATLWKLPLRGGPETRVLEDSVYALNFAITQRGIYYIPVDFGPVGVSGSKIRFLDFSTQKTQLAASAEHWPMPGLAVSHDGRTLAVTEADMLASDLMAVENYK
jgi:Tol biopolymer transport system component/DNA-binding winged helix-turn-helix (wHTH) protein